jgi:hypothetical protein
MRRWENTQVGQLQGEQFGLCLMGPLNTYLQKPSHHAVIHLISCICHDAGYTIHIDLYQI